MKPMMFGIGVTLIGVALWYAPDAAVPDGVASKLVGAGCGYDNIRSNGDSCDKNAEGVWTCGPHTNLEAYAGDGSMVTDQEPCGSTGCKNTNVLDDCDES